MTGTDVVTPSQVLPSASLPRPDLFTDLANSHALIAMADRELCYTPGIGWHFWDGTRFQHDDGDVYVSETAKRAILANVRLVLEHQAAMTDDEVKAWRHWLKRSQNDGLLKSMLRVARTDSRINAYVRDLDARPNELNTQTGILDLDTFELRDHDPAALHTKECTRAGYDPKAQARFGSPPSRRPCPTRPCAGTRQEYLGQSLLGWYSEHMLVAWGQTGSNLKSTIFGAVEDVLGDYACRASSDLLSTTPPARRDPTRRSLRREGCDSCSRARPPKACR